MALIKSWKIKEITGGTLCDILNVFIIYITRRRIIGVVQAENKNFPTLVKKVPQLVKTQDKKREMFKILSSMENHLRLPNDIEMERELSVMNYLIQEVLPIPDDMRKTNNFVMKMNGLSFLELQLIGQTIDYASDNSIHAKVVSDKEVEFEGKNGIFHHLREKSRLKRELLMHQGRIEDHSIGSMTE